MTVARRLTRPGPGARVWCFMAFISGCALALSVGGRIFTGARPPGWLVPWWVLATGVMVAELLPVHLVMRRNTWSASLIEVPLVIGLTMSSPAQVVIGQLVGCAVARGLIHRQALQKFFFNMALCALESAAAVLVFRVLAHGAPLQNPKVWVAAYGAVLVEGVISSVGLVAVIAIVSGAPPRDLGGNVVLGAVVVPAAGTALALQAAITVRDNPGAAVLLAVTVSLLAFGYRAYGRLRVRYANLQLLYDFTEAVKGASNERSSVEGVLEAARQVLGAEIAELVVSDGGEGFRRHVVGGSSPSQTDPASASWEAITTTTSGLLAPRGTRDPEAVRWLSSGAWTDGMVVPIRRDGHTIGSLAVMNHEGAVATFDRDAFHLFGTLANHAAVALENTELIDRLTFEASHDGLTELGNRQEFNRRLQHHLEQRRPGQKIAVALLDLDRFKEINDTLGHHTGDELLAWFGHRMAELLPSSAIAARLGGDEFAVAVCYEGSKDDAVAVVNRTLRPLWSEPFRVGEVGVAVDVCGSVGVSVAPDDAEDASTLLQRSDVAMYVAKRHGGTGNVAPYRQERDTNTAQKLALAAELRLAITDGLLDVHFQPQVDLSTGLIAGAEALVRWTHPQRGPLSPDEFIPLAERTGLIVPLTELVLNRSLEACKSWHAAGMDLSVAVNVSVRSLADGEIVATVARLLERHSLASRWLTIEVTESGVMEDERRNVGVLEALAGLGLRLAIDDFGTGYSSLSYLKRLPVQEVKIDKSFVTGMEDDAADAAIVRSVIELARNLKLSVVAEGVETATAMSTLASLGCDVAQGYHIGRAVSADALLAAARRWNEGGTVIPFSRNVRLAAGI